MNFVRRQWLALFVVLAVLFSFVANRRESAQRDGLQNKASIAVCVAGSARTAIVADGWRRLADRVSTRGAPGDAESAANYEGTALTLIGLIPVAPEDEGSSDIAKVWTAPGERLYSLAPEARRVQYEGCAALFK